MVSRAMTSGNTDGVPLPGGPGVSKAKIKTGLVQAKHHGGCVDTWQNLVSQTEVKAELGRGQMWSQHNRDSKSVMGPA